MSRVERLGFGVSHFLPIFFTWDFGCPIFFTIGIQPLGQRGGGGDDVLCHALFLDDGQKVLPGELGFQFQPDFQAVLVQLLCIPALFGPNHLAALPLDRVLEVALDPEFAGVRIERVLGMVTNLPKLALDAGGFPAGSYGEILSVELFFHTAMDPMTRHPRE